MNNHNIDAPPVMMYLHGFMSGANGAKQRQLQKRFKGRYRVMAPELYAEPERSLRIINDMIAKEKPEIIVGTSLGGFMALECDSCDADLVIVNPCLFPETQLAVWRDEELTYFCKRIDGVQTYRLTQEVLDMYRNYDAVATAKAKRLRTWALCSTADDLLGTSHVEALTDVLPEGHISVVDDFGHQCNGEGLTHLYDMVESVVSQRESR